jgi:hypothetical protein
MQHFIPSNRWKRILANAFILFNLSAVLLGSSKMYTTPLIVRQFYFPYLRWTRLLQGWLLFTPEPRRYSLKYEIEIIYENNHRVAWQRPYPPKWDFFERHLSYNFQKFDLAADYLVTDKDVRYDYCSYVLRLHWSDINPPQVVRLLTYRAEWPEPNSDGPLEYDETKLTWIRHVMASYNVVGHSLEKL